MEGSILRIRDLYVSYGKIKAINGVSIEVKKGECVAIVGANGAGKSTLLKSIMGFVKRQKGEILFLDKKIDGLATHTIAKMGISFVPEGARVFPSISVYGNLLLGAYKEKDKTTIKRRLERVYGIFPRLKERLNQAAGTLSGGERQMLAMARALMGEPKLLMVDEVSLGLMPKLVDVVFDVIDRLHKEGLTILLSEQNAHKASEVADRIYILELGKILKETDRDGILNDPLIKKAYLGM
ncbi:ABC transporter ATP-binding protein [Hippea maritima]|uniref:ABC transporter related protein n=1 Tax=Hippea maritima (strain ATCC 700847 / DSM 10411 / MH2) TaxID=760142 RepID=F2LUH9_HIPMA|nr:ABC transporter ATP-binding protein [Hippea maritima]AEA34569.1 ABC transporter related protein [Hippea maritima DSM 10411]